MEMHSRMIREEALHVATLLGREADPEAYNHGGCRVLNETGSGPSGRGAASDLRVAVPPR